MRLAICEKPSVAADVARALSTQHRFEKTEWGYRSQDLLVAAAAGHLVAELPPEKYDEKYKTWNFEDLPIVPERFMYEPRDQRAAQRLRQIAALIRDEQVTELVNCCDAGREGELIFKLIVQYAKLSTPKPVKRAWFASMTESAIAAAFASLRDDAEMAGLEAAARCRAEADWLVGMNATRAATCTLGGGRRLLSVGRVQTPTLALVVERDLAIESFEGKEFFTVRAGMAVRAGGFEGWWREHDQAGAADRFENREDADAVAARILGTGTGTVRSIEVHTETVRPPRLFDLTDLQREANKRHGFTATRTLAAAQACYEEHKVLSYPRTDSRYLTTDMAPLVAGLVRRVKAADPALSVAADTVLANLDPQVVIDDTKVSDHHALIPTDAAHDLSKLSDDQRKIYDLVVRRFLAALCEAQQIERTVVYVEVRSRAAEGEVADLLRATGRRDLVEGWRVAWPEATRSTKKPAKGETSGEEDGEEADTDKELPSMAVGDQVLVPEVEVIAGRTKPPARYTEASLLGAMATAGALVDDEDLAEAMKERGLGTPATRASILERLVKVEYLERTGRSLRATDKGRGLVLALGAHPLVRAQLTGEWEMRLRLLERSPQDAATMRAGFVGDVRNFTRELVAGFSGMAPTMLQAGRRTLAECPMPGCDGKVIEGKRGWGCSSWVSKEETGCGFVHWKEQAGKKVTEAQLLKYVAAVRAGEVAPPAARGPRVVLGACPRCDGSVVERPRSWGCDSWKSPKQPGCGYTIFKTNPDGSEVDGAGAAQLLARGETNERPKPAAFAPCPRCEGELLDRGNFLGCNSWRSPRQKGCGTVVFKSRNNEALSEEQLRAEIAAMVGTEAPKRRGRKSS